MRTTSLSCCLAGALLSMLASTALSQSEPVPAALKPAPAVVDAKTPPARNFHDRRYGIAFRVPAGWNLSQKDGDVSTLRLDARTTTAATHLRAVASMAFNPLPSSTFSGALFYVSVTPGITADQCRSQVSKVPANDPRALPRVVSSVQIGGVAFEHSHDEHGGVCVESRDEVYTAARKDGCYRFDLVLNNFCGGDVSGVRDMTEHEIDSVRKRLDDILATVKFEN